MATWMTHIRIAELLISKYPKQLKTEHFLIGNIAPDCGVPTQSKNHFDPPKEVTHFKDHEIDYEQYDQINLDRYFNAYVLPNLGNDDFTFFLGYYLHLFVDILWHQYQMNKRKDQTYDQNFKEQHVIYRQELLQLDLQYIHEHDQSIYKSQFEIIKDVKDYVDYIPKGMINNHVKHIQSFYAQPYYKISNPIFTSYDDLEGFIMKSSLYILSHLEFHNLL